MAGFEYDRDSFKNMFVEDAGDAPFMLGRNSYAFFAENRWTPADRWFINAGVRVDDIQTDMVPANMDTGQPGIPANTIAKVTPENFRGVSGAQRRRVMDFSARRGCMRASEPAFARRMVSNWRSPNNPNLKPEESISFDAGIEQRMAQDRAILDVTYFYNKFKDQIVTHRRFARRISIRRISDDRGPYGLETTIRFRPIRSLEFSGSYTWTEYSRSWRWTVS